MKKHALFLDDQQLKLVRAALKYYELCRSFTFSARQQKAADALCQITRKPKKSLDTLCSQGMRRVVGQGERAVSAHEEPEQTYAGTDVICNILHYLRNEHKIEPVEALATAFDHYKAEYGTGE